MKKRKKQDVEDDEKQEVVLKIVRVSPHRCRVNVELAGFCRNTKEKQKLYRTGLYRRQISLTLDLGEFTFYCKNVNSCTMFAMLSDK